MSALEGLRRGRDLRVPGLFLDGTAVLEGRGISLAYDGRPILVDVDVAVRAGEVLTLVGPNGAGKSTLLGVLTGDIAPDTGTVIVDGAPMASWTANELAVRRGVLLQQVDVSFPFTVVEVVRMGRAPWSGTRAEDWDDHVAAEALAETDVGHLGSRIYTSLSGGERSRAALSRVLAQEPSALLLDEPTASLDIRHQELMLNLARARAARGDAVVIVMHDLALAAAHADIVMVLCTGRVAATGPPEEVLTSNLLSEVYEYPIEILRHPNTGTIVVLPQRSRSLRWR